jgi:phosphoribosyl 1,2-cyclic phosphodiesterase
MEFLSIASGSSGNCLCVGNNSTRVLVDAGLSGKKTEEGLRRLDMAASELDGILVTHEHIDHIGGLGVLARRYGLPMYATEKTVQAILSMEKKVGKIDPALFTVIRKEEDFTVGSLTIRPVPISHDAADPVAYVVKSNGQSMGICTDLGVYDEALVREFTGMDVLFLEANHDVRMLEAGPYPYPLKQRILGERGHLSNDTSGELLCRLLHDHLRHIFLGHLSQENNLPELAYETVRLTVTLEDVPYQGSDFPFTIAKRDVPGEVFAW